MDYITVYRNSEAGIKRSSQEGKWKTKASRVGCLPRSNCVNLGYIQMSAPVETGLKKARAGAGLKRAHRLSCHVLDVVLSPFSHVVSADRHTAGLDSLVSFPDPSDG